MPKIALLIFTLFFFATQVEANCGQVCDDAWLKLGKNPTETDLRAIITGINGIKPENAEKKLLLKVSDQMMKFIKNSNFTAERFYLLKLSIQKDIKFSSDDGLVIEEGNECLTVCELFWLRDASYSKLADTILKEKNMNQKNTFGETPLHFAANLGDDLKLIMLWVSGGSLYHSNQSNQIPLHYAAQRSDDITLIAHLMTENSKFKKAYTTYFKDDLGDTPLFHAAWAKSPKNAKFLIKSQFDVNERNKSGWTPLHYAARAGTPEIIFTMLEAGANLEARSIFGETPLLNAISIAYSTKNLLALLKSGADVNAADGRGYTALHLAIDSVYSRIPEDKQEDAIITLLNHGANVNIKSVDGTTPWLLVQSNDFLRGSKAYWAMNDARFK